jgi:hypothetical protein
MVRSSLADSRGRRTTRYLLLTLPDPFAEAPSTALKVGHHGQRINGVQGFPNDI